MRRPCEEEGIPSGPTRAVMPPAARVMVALLKSVCGACAGVLVVAGGCFRAYSLRWGSEAARQWWEKHLAAALVLGALAGGAAALVVSAAHARYRSKKASRLADKIRGRRRQQGAAPEDARDAFPDDL